MFSKKLLGIMILSLLIAGVSLTLTRCYDDSEARVTIHLERNDLAFNKDIKQKRIIDRVLEFFSTRAEAVAAPSWDSAKKILGCTVTLYVTSPGLDDKTFSIPYSSTDYTVIVPQSLDVTFTLVSVYSSTKNWGGHATVDLHPGDQDIILNMIPIARLVTQNGTSINLDWSNTSASGNTLKYNIYRSNLSNGTYSIIYSGNALNYLDTPPIAGTYYYKISVVSTSGEEGVLSDAVPATRS